MTWEWLWEYFSQKKLLFKNQMQGWKKKFFYVLVVNLSTEYSVFPSAQNHAVKQVC